MQAGFAIRELDPPLGMPMGGYAARVGVASGVRDPLQCRCCLVRGRNGGGVVLASLDLLCVSSAWSRETRRQISAAVGVDPTAVLIAATHTHSGPALFGFGAAPETTRDYEARLRAIVVAAAQAADAGCESVSLAFGSEPVSGVAADRTDGHRSLESRLDAVVARNGEGHIAGVVASYGCHPTILPPANLEYSRDLFGAAVEVGEAGACAPVILFNGAAGDVSTRFTRRGQGGSEVDRLGAILGGAIRRAVASATRLTGGQVAAAVREMEVQWRPRPDAESAARAVAEAQAAVRAADERGASTADRRLAQARLEGAVAQLFRASSGGRAVLSQAPEHALVQHLRIGGCHVIAAPGEILAADGASVRAGRALPTLVIGYANGYLGYLVTPKSAEAGSYEAQIAEIAPPSAAAIVGEMARGGGPPSSD